MSNTILQDDGIIKLITWDGGVKITAEPEWAELWRRQQALRSDTQWLKEDEFIPICQALDLLALYQDKTFMEVAQDLRLSGTLKQLSVVGNTTSDDLEEKIEELAADTSLSDREAEHKLRAFLGLCLNSSGYSWRTEEFFNCKEVFEVGLCERISEIDNRTDVEKRIDIMKCHMVRVAGNSYEKYEQVEGLYFPNRERAQKLWDKVKKNLDDDDIYTGLCGTKLGEEKRDNAAEGPVGNAIKNDRGKLRKIYQDKKGIPTRKYNK
ncbi:hypothetical protein OHV61_11450 [Acinetobacter baumannii]|nr:hypothetical protein [Acinetobacter baumannii]